MNFLRSLTGFLRKRSQTKTPQTQASTRLKVEELEDRVTPSFTGIASTYTNATVQITPNISAFSVTETVTASVTTIPTYNSTTGQTTPVPAGAGTPTGTVLFNLNNQMQSAALNANGQATATFTLPLLALFTSQTLQAAYTGTGNSSVSGTYDPSIFLAPLYQNFNNLLLPATLTFGQLTPLQQAYIYNSTLTQISAFPSFYTAQGETDNLGILSYKYVDPGIINSVSVLGLNLPGIFAFATGAYNGLSSSSSTSSSST